MGRRYFVEGYLEMMCGIASSMANGLDTPAIVGGQWPVCAQPHHASPHLVLPCLVDGEGGETGYTHEESVLKHPWPFFST